jgi:hypothetical protein
VIAAWGSCGGVAESPTSWPQRRPSIESSDVGGRYTKLLALAAADVGGIRRGAVVAVAVALLGMALLGMAFGRLAARIVERPAAFYPSWFFFWVEAVGGGLLLSTAGW